MARSAATFMLATPEGERSVFLRLPGLYNVYNALAATSLCLALGIPLEHDHQRSGGSDRRLRPCRDHHGWRHCLQILLIKNPAGANEILRTLALESDQLDVLAILNDNIADGRDVSWVWDADFELLSSRLRSVTCSGTRAAEFAVRLKYAGVPETALSVVPDLSSALDQAVAEPSRSPLCAADLYRDVGPA